MGPKKTRTSDQTESCQELRNKFRQATVEDREKRAKAVEKSSKIYDSLLETRLEAEDGTMDINKMKETQLKSNYCLLGTHRTDTYNVQRDRVLFKRMTQGVYDESKGRRENSNFDSEIFAERLKSFAFQVNNSQEITPRHWINLYNNQYKYQGASKRPPSLVTLMYLPSEDTFEEIKSRKTRKTPAKRDNLTNLVTTKISDKKEATHEDETNKLVNLMKKRLRSVYKRRETPIPLYEFVCHPDKTDGFTKTAENLFYLSFLIKSRNVEISFPEDGESTIIPVSNEGYLQSGDYNDDTETHLLTTDYQTWKKFREKYKNNKYYFNVDEEMSSKKFKRS